MTDKPTLMAMRGLPGSGKTRAAKAWVSEDPANRARVGRDALRDALYGTRKGLGSHQEVIVSKVQQSAVRELLKAGKHVVVDDLNLKAKYLRGFAKIAAECNAGFEVIDVNTPVDQCVANDKGREHSVGEEAIRSLDRRFRHRPKIELPKDRVLDVVPYEPNLDKPQAWIVDVDGTLALKTGDRGWYDMTRVGEDEPNKAVVQVVQDLAECGYEILICSGRTDDGEIATAEWLTEHLGHDRWSELFTRKTGDQRPDNIIKLEIFNEYIRDHYNVVGVIDDRDSVVDLWRSLGLTCFQPARGDF